FAMRMYVEDNARYPRSKYLGAADANRGFQQSWFWSDDIERYLGAQWTNEIYRCPDYRGATRIPRLGRDWFVFTTLLGSYGYNGWITDFSLHNPEPIGGGPSLVSDSQVVAPSDMIMGGDANLHGAFDGKDYQGPPDEIPWAGDGTFWKHGDDQSH